MAGPTFNEFRGEEPGAREGPKKLREASSIQVGHFWIWVETPSMIELVSPRPEERGNCPDLFTRRSPKAGRSGKY